MSFDILDDKEIFDKLKKAELAERLLASPEWKLLKEAALRIVDRAISKFALSTKADDLVAIIELQIIIRKYKFGLFEEIDLLAQEGIVAFEEAKDRQLISKA